MVPGRRFLPSVRSEAVPDPARIFEMGQEGMKWPRARIVHVEVTAGQRPFKAASARIDSPAAERGQHCAH